MLSLCVSFQFFYVFVYAAKLIWDTDVLGAVRNALAAADAMVGLAYGLDGLVVAGQISAAQAPVLFLLGRASQFC